MATQRWWIVLNGKSAGDEEVRATVAAARERGIDVAVRVTWEAGDAARIVDEACVAGATTVVAAGGDGTVNEVTTALAQRDPASPSPAVGVLPLGTANDFATSAGIPPTMEDAAALWEQPPVAVDMLRLDGDETTHWAVNLASGGFGTEVTTDTGEGLKKALGGLAYVISGLAKLARLTPLQARITGPGVEWEGDFVALAVGNGRQAGGGQVLCPDALIDDGRLDLTVVPPLSGEIVASIGTALTAGTAAALDRVAVRHTATRLTITSPEPLTLNLDGEPSAARVWQVECVPGRVRMHLPANCPLRMDRAR